MLDSCLLVSILEFIAHRRREIFRLESESKTRPEGRGNSYNRHMRDPTGVSGRASGVNAFVPI